jgi:hypothetical protein
MVAQIISMEMGMGVMAGREVWFFLGVMRLLRMRMVQGMVLVQFFLPGLVRADISARGGLGIIRPTIRAVSGCHIHYSPYGDKNTFPEGPGETGDYKAATREKW